MEETRPPLPKEQQGFRLKPKHLLWIVGLGLGIYMLLPRVGQLSRLPELWGSADVVWLAVGLAVTVLSYVLAAFIQFGAVGQRFSLGHSIVAQVAAMFAGNVGPHQGVGNFYVLERYIEKSGIDRRRSITATTLIMATQVLVHGLMVLGIVGLIGWAGVSLARDIRPWQIAVVVGATAVLLIFIAFSPKRVRSVRRTVIASARDLAAALTHPVRALELVGGSIAVTLTYILALYASLWAVGAHVSMLHAAGVYLLGTMIGSASPTPGGLGVLESAFVAGLAAFGIPGDRAVAGVLLYRFLTFWLPILPGLLAFRYLQREGCL